ncbi:hypothetical protein NP493_395g01018 [Ridgeia piscesae]|uniref:Uncharacterized protein n=1 Tax=Ridgeia piscesae TaxID=27915 RepID=A0AAD9L2F4_RIDPI|nr:hypothetical protein NP493_395g01018 [Ridgeia piscesae]
MQTNASDIKAQCPRWMVTLKVRICMGRSVTSNESALTGVTLSLMAPLDPARPSTFQCSRLASLSSWLAPSVSSSTDVTSNVLNNPCKQQCLLLEKL